MTHTQCSFAVALTVAAAGAAAQPHHHDDDFVVGVNSAGQLMIEGDFDEHLELPPIDSGGTVGWLGDEPGFTNLDEDEPAEDFFVLAAGADIQFHLVGTDPAMKVYDPFFTLMAPGDAFALGGHEFDEHPFWHIDSNDPSFNANQTEWQVQFTVVDSGSTAFAESPVYTATFTNVPTPASALIIGALGLRAGQRRRA